MRLAWIAAAGFAALATNATAQVETRPPNAAHQTPAFPGQTRAPEMKAHVAFDVQPVAAGLKAPWGMTFLPDGRMLVTEKEGALRIVGRDGALSEPVAGVPTVDARRQGGLLDVALDPDFPRNRLVYLTYAEAGEGGVNGTAAARARLAESGASASLQDLRVIFRQQPKIEAQQHYGSRLVFARDGALFITTGDRSVLPGRHQAQRLDSAIGKVIRIRPDGEIPTDNPFVGRADARPEIWSIGHRNLQAAALHPVTGELWTVEHGAEGGDELNRPEKGKDYGWPTITYGREYSDAPIGEGITQKEGMEQPVYYWDPVIAPSGMAFYNAPQAPGWKNSLFIGAHGGRHLVRLTMDGDRVVGEERLLTDLGARIRDVRVGPNGAVYVLINDPANGRIVKLVPRS